MKPNREVIAVTVSLALGIVIGISIEEKLSSLAFRDFGTILATLAAAFLGAHYAFALNRQKDEEKTKRENLAAGNRAIFTMAMQANKLWLFQNQIVDPHRNDPARFINMRAASVTHSEVVNVDIDSLVFLLEHGHGNLLGRISVADSKYDGAIAALQQRSKIHINEAQPRMELSPTLPRNLEEVNRALGQRISLALQSATDQVVEHVDSARPYIEEVGSELNRVLRELFPGNRVISFSMPARNQDSAGPR